MKLSSRLFYKAIITEYLEDLDFNIYVTLHNIIATKGNIKVKMGIGVAFIYDMSKKPVRYQLLKEVRFNETKSLDKLRDFVTQLLKESNEIQNKGNI